MACSPVPSPLYSGVYGVYGTDGRGGFLWVPLSRSLCGLLISSLPQARETGMLSDLTKETVFLNSGGSMIGSLLVFGALFSMAAGAGSLGFLESLLSFLASAGDASCGNSAGLPEIYPDTL